MLHEFKYAAPKTRAELFDLLGSNLGKAKVLAGGTDLLVNIRNGVMKPELVIDLKKIDGFAGLEYSDSEGLIIHPATTINEVLKHPAVRDHYPLLQECGHDLASYQIRNRATVMGNVVNASPCSDMAPALLCLDAQAVLGSARGSRTVPFNQFFTGVKKTVLAQDEVLEKIVIPSATKNSKGSYKKLKRIAGHDLGIIGVAVVIVQGKINIAVSSAAPTPVSVRGLDLGISEADAVAAVRKVISPISDVRCTKEYREFMTDVFVKRLLAEVRL